mgnify:CR=1 FL=1
MDLLLNFITSIFYKKNLDYQLGKFFATASETYTLIHAHGNNYGGRSEENGLPNVLELTFSKKGTHPKVAKELIAPINGLDNPNNRRLPDYSFSIIN